jgi:hypothetical protein
MILLVLSMHAADTYSPFGSWYFTDRPTDPDTGTVLTFAIYQSFLQAFFMALLFFISGCFASPALQRKGRVRFARDRSVRLGLPTLLYMLVIGPLTQYFLSHTWGDGGFLHQWVVHLQDGEWLSNTGPMWFCAALLIFSLLYAALPAAGDSVPGPAAPLPGHGAVTLFAVAMVATTFAIRILVPEGRSVLNMHPGDFPSYVLMFAAGTAAGRGHWLAHLPQRFARTWAIGSLIASLPLLATLIALRYVFHSEAASDGGLTLNSGIRCLWETLVCIGMGFGLIALYRSRFNGSNVAAGFLADNAFAVYVFHPPVLIALAIALQGFSAPPLVKAVVLTAATAIATFGLSALVLRRIPVLRAML